MSASERFDVAVVGGGPAGVAAALGAARAGARTLLVEREAQLGGNVTQAFVHTSAGSTGATRSARFRRRSDCRCAWRRGSHASARRASRRERAASSTCRSCRRASARSPPSAARARRARAAASTTLSELSPDLADVVVDASGDAAVAEFAGAATELAPTDRLQRASYIVRLEGAAETGLAGFARLQLTAGVARAASRGELPADCASVVVRPDGRPGSLFLTLTLPPLEGRPSHHTSPTTSRS